MLVNIQGRKIEVTQPLKSYALEKVSVLNKYLDGNVKVHMTLAVDKKFQQRAEVSVTAKNLHLKGVEESEDMYASIDKVMDKIARQAKKFKEKVKDHHAKDKDSEADVAREIIRESSENAPQMSDDEAIQEIIDSNKLALVYKSPESEKMKVAYYRSDGLIAIMEA